MADLRWTEEQLAEHYQKLGLPPTVSPKAVKIPKPRMNKWEAEYEALLRAKWGRGEIQWYAFEPIKLRLAKATTYTPDFAVLDKGVLEFHEVKGFWREDALVKFKVAAGMFPFTFTAWRKKKVREGGGFLMIRYINQRSEIVRVDAQPEVRA